MDFTVYSGMDSPKLAHAILVYKSGKQTFATKHDVTLRDGGPFIRAGRRLTEADYTALVDGLKENQKPKSGWVDERVLASGPDYQVWWTPAQQRSMFFKNSDRFGGTFDGQGICATPALVWMRKGSSLYVYAVKDEGRPTKESALYQAPFFNVWSSGQVCVGTANPPKGERLEDPKAWEDFFFKSNFTHPNFSEKGRLIKGHNPVEFWKKQIEKPSRRFPSSVLVPLKFTVIDLLDEKTLNKLNKQRATGEF